MNIIITRPRDDAEKLAAQIFTRGHTPVIAPLIAIVPRTTIVLPPQPWQALCLTSANGIAAIPTDFARDVPVYCVGPHSAAAAMAQGFTTVRHRGGDVDGLAEFIVENCKPESGPLLYLSGAVTSGDLNGKLTHLGYSVTRVVAYDAVPTSPDNLTSMISAADAVVLYSQRTAQLWLAANETAKCVDKAAAIATLCLSPHVASRLPQSWHKRVAETADEAGMLHLIEGLT